jgi:hypothetical protein
LRLKADYTGSEIEFGAAEKVVTQAEKFVRTVEREFGLETHTKTVAEEKDASIGRVRDGDSTFSTASLGDSSAPAARRLSPEDTRRKAREDWLKNYYHKNDSPDQAAPETDSSRKEAQKDVKQPQPEKDAGADYDPE